MSEQSFVSLYHAYSVSNDSILMWICKITRWFMIDNLCILFMGDGLCLLYNLICRTGKEYRKKQGKLIVHELI
jgi:hypothetical protein